MPVAYRESPSLTSLFAYRLMSSRIAIHVDPAGVALLPERLRSNQINAEGIANII